MATWTRDQPGVGDTAAISTLSGGLSTYGFHVADRVASVESSVGDLAEWWQGKAAKSFGEAVAKVSVVAAAPQLAAGAVSSALSTYGSQVDSLRSRGAQAQAELSDAKLRSDSARSAITRASMQSVSPQAMASLRSTAATAKADVTHANDAVDDLALERTNADNQAVAAINAATEKLRAARAQNASFLIYYTTGIAAALLPMRNWATDPITVVNRSAMTHCPRGRGRSHLRPSTRSGNMHQTSVDFASGRAVAQQLIAGSDATISLAGQGGASGCGSPAVASAVAEFEAELTTYVNDLTRTIGGIGAAAKTAIADLEELERAHVSTLKELRAGPRASMIAV